MPRIKVFLIHNIVFLCLGMNPAMALQPAGTIDLTAYSAASRVPTGSDIYIALVIDIAEGFHINSNRPLEELYHPTAVTYAWQEGLSFGRVLYPEGEVKKFAFSENELSVYEDRIKVFTPVTISDRVQPGPLTLNGTFAYQACNDKVCFFPQTIEFSLPVEIVAASEALIPINEALFSDVQEWESRAEGLAVLNLTRQEIEAQSIVDRGLLYAVAAFFLFGLALNLTPCVYPVIPITVSYFSSRQGEKQGYTRALVYVVGIALVFALLGLISGLAGKQWGFLFQNPWFTLTITLLILSMAASMFGAFEIRIPSPILTRLGQAREGVMGSFIMGLTVGVVIAPCAAGIIIGLVGLVAKLGIVVQGTILFFVMGLGLGLPYLFLARFSGLIQALPQSGIWLIWIKKLFGVMLVGVALYFFLPQANSVPDMQGFFFGLLTVFAGLYLGFLDSASSYTPFFKKIRWLLGLGAVVYGLTMTHAAIQVRASAIVWHHYSDEALSELLDDGKPVFFDFYADWCAPCLEMDRKTFTDQGVIDLAESFKMVKVDCTAPDAGIRRFMQQFQVTGMPTLIFLDDRGSEFRDLREIGFINASRFENAMQRVLAQY